MSDCESEPYEEFEDYEYDVEDDLGEYAMMGTPQVSTVVRTTGGGGSGPVATLSEGDVFAVLEERIKGLADVLGWSTDSAALVLPKFQWSKDRAQERYFEDPEGVMKLCGITEKDTQTQPLVANMEEIECQSCWDDFQPGEAYALQCFHWFCRSCWVTNMLHTIEKQGVSALPSKRCPFAKCTVPCGMSTFREILEKSHPHHWKKYQRFLIKTFVDDATDYTFCSHPDCECIVHTNLVRGPQCQDVKCDKCNHPFCFKCGEDLHAPAECEQLVSWRKKEQDDSETANWMVVNTKPCPKCRRVTEKNGGCNHMNCPQCKYDWCWVCEGDWSKHGSSWYKCNYYDEKKDSERWSKDKARMELEKYIHYYSRFRNHEQSSKLDRRTLEKTRERIREEINNSKDLQVYDVDYLERTAKTLIRCRQVLKYTYIFSYYLDDAKKKELFEYNQNMLEYHTELLSEFIEDRSGKFNRQEVVNRTSSAEMMLKNLEEGVSSEY